MRGRSCPHLQEMDPAPSAPPESHLQAASLQRSGRVKTAPWVPEFLLVPKGPGLPHGTAVTHLFLWSASEPGLNRLLFRSLSTCLSSGRLAQRSQPKCWCLWAQGAVPSEVSDFRILAPGWKGKQMHTHSALKHRRRHRAEGGHFLILGLEPFWT